MFTKVFVQNKTQRPNAKLTDMVFITSKINLVSNLDNLKLSKLSSRSICTQTEVSKPV